MTDELVSTVVERLRPLEGVVAIALGGSRARGTHASDSDVDIGLYYRDASPFSIEAVRAVARELDDSPDPVVTGFGAWGRWVNGGAWLTVGGQRLDFIYRSLDDLDRTIEECRAGRFESDFFLQQPPYGFHSYVYLGELSICRPLHDPQGDLADLKRRIQPYPEPLKRAIVNRFLWAAQFTLQQARKFAARGDVYDGAGAMSRAASFLVQVLYALNERYFVHDKGALVEIERFDEKPDGFGDTLTACLSSTAVDELEGSVRRLEELTAEVERLCGSLYRAPDFRA